MAKIGVKSQIKTYRYELVITDKMFCVRFSDSVLNKSSEGESGSSSDLIVACSTHASH